MVSAWEKMKDRKDLITKSFQVTGITSTDPKVVCNDEVLKRAMEAAQKELSLEKESGDKSYMYAYTGTLCSSRAELTTVTSELSTGRHVHTQNCRFALSFPFFV